MAITESIRGRLLAGAATGAMLMFAAPAQAQETDTETTAQTPATVDEETGQEDGTARLDVVTVSGIRGSIRNSLNVKKNETSIVEAISAEDIGKLPDLSIADSLARLPGVTAQRVRGRSQQISIRGLGPDFSLALLNGREVVSAGNNRGVEFDQFPSELIAQGVVYKSPDATLAATGIAGAVDLRTVRPLDYSNRQFNLSGKYVLNDNGQLNPDFDDDGYRYFASYIDQNEAGTIGWSLGATIQSNPTQFYSRELKTNQGQTSSTEPGGGTIYPSDNPRTGVSSREFERTSVAGTLQFEPSGRWQTVVDGFYTDTEDSGIFRGVETPIASWSGTSADVTPGNGAFADSATYAPVNPILRTDTEGSQAEILALGINSTYAVTERLSITGDVSYSSLDRSDVDYESYAGTGFAGSGPTDTLRFTFPDNGEYSIGHDLDYTDPGTVVLTDPGGWGQVGFLRETDIEDELSQIRLEAEYALDVPFISGLTGGVLKTDREKTFNDNPFYLRESEAFTDGEVTIPDGSVIGQTDSGDIGLDIIAYNPGPLLSDGTYFVQDCEEVAGCVETEWVVEEDVTTWYGMATIDSEIGDMPLRGNVGFQYVDTTQTSTGTLAGSGTQTIEEDYTNFLPSLNLSLEVMPDTLVRFAAAKTLTRARLDQLAANQSFNRNTLVCPDGNGDGVPDAVVDADPPERTCSTLEGGNPFLRPYKSTQFDIAFEKYFGEASALSVAFFRKEFDDWVLDRSVIVDGTQYYEASGLGDFAANNPEVVPTRLSGPVNFADGSMEGYELTARISLDDVVEMPPALEGFGFGASYTFTENGLEDETGNEITIPGQSDIVWSGDVYYENHGWQAKLSARRRSGFLSEILQFDGTLSGARAMDETILDAQIGYEWGSGPLEGFAVNLEVYNITDEPFRTENQLFYDPAVAGGPDVPTSEYFVSRHELYGTTYNFTISKSF
ncbi:TonB-dependent receptor [Henriciella aquimarina]|uniref:TonB-dependent receptor n=1 Tax=Henriciella aquimarina TaxID=545261 RepID=UPI000A00E4D0|nr:TonB-dependent receptor [Henriciella aquimarina]